MVSQDTLRVLLNVEDDSILRHLYQDCMNVSNVSRRSCALVLAAQVFMYVALRQLLSQSPIVRRMCTRLQSTVGSTPLSRETWLEERRVGKSVDQV